MQFLTHYERYNVSKWEQRQIMPQSNFIALNNSFMNHNSSLIGFQIEHEDKRVHYSVSNMYLDRLQAQFPDNWLDILNDGMVYEFKQWERGIYSNMYQEGFFQLINLLHKS